MHVLLILLFNVPAMEMLTKKARVNARHYIWVKCGVMLNQTVHALIQSLKEEPGGPMMLAKEGLNRKFNTHKCHGHGQLLPCRIQPCSG